MLVLSRKKNESIVINNEVTIVVVEIRGDKVRLGVEAPKDVPVHRKEVYDAIQRNSAVDGGVATAPKYCHRCTRLVSECQCPPVAS